MKTSRLFYSLGLVLLAAILTFTACKKRKAFNDEDGQSSIDNKNVMSENDAAIGDVNDIISGRTNLSGRSSGTSGVTGITGNACGLTIDSVDINQGSVKLVYDGTTCRNRTRTGTIKLTIIDHANGKRWKHAGCQMKVEYINYKVTRASDGKSIELNGTQTITNETGGTWWELLIAKSQPSLAHTIKGTGLDVTFEDGKMASYNINRRITYTFPDDVLTCTAEGIGSLNGINNLENYGITRNGFDFTSQVITPVVWNLTCGPWAPVQGEVHIKVDERDFTLKVTFSVDASGSPVASSANSCAYGWKVEWSHKKKTKKKVTGYY
jgi:hypothetical protein